MCHSHSLSWSSCCRFTMSDSPRWRRSSSWKGDNRVGACTREGGGGHASVRAVGWGACIREGGGGGHASVRAGVGGMHP